MKRYGEIGGLLLLLVLGLALRLAFVTRFPTIPFSDFSVLVLFGRHLHDHGIFANEWFWEYFNPGMPLVLSMLFRIFHGTPDSVARIATVLTCGLIPLAPYLIWRGVFPLWVRMLAGLSLAVWPGQVLFSGVVAQDNWVLLPTVALAALAVRSLVSGEPGRPVIAGLLLAAGVIMRQEMLVVLFPLFLAAAGVSVRAGWRRWVSAGLAVGLPLVALACYRGIATGRYTLSSEHSGLAVLGAYIPGAVANAWVDPYPFIASVRPDLLRDRKALLSQSSMLAVQEALRRPGFHAARILSLVCNFSVTGEASSLYWSIGRPDVLPEPLRQRGAELFSELATPLRYEMAGIEGLFLAAILVGIRRRNWAILVLVLAVLLKYAIHAAIAAQGRYFYAATAMEILAIVLAMYEVWTAPRAGKILLVTAALVLGVAFSISLLLIRPRLNIYVLTHDFDPQRTYRFPLMVKDRGATLDCVVSHGLLMTLNIPRESTQNASIRTALQDPPWGDSSAAVCELTGAGEPRPLTLEVLDPYAPGGFPNRLVQRVEVDGAEVYYHDIAKDPGSGWAKIQLGNVGEGTRRKVVVEVKAIRPDPGPGWGNAAITTFQLSRD